MKADKILFIDTETGGLEPSTNSLLSIAFVVWLNFEIIDSIEILIDDGILNVTQQAMKINGIDLERHKLNSVPEEEAIILIEHFLNNHYNEKEKITLGGHNVNFDVNFLRTFLTKNNFNFHKRFSHRHVDTSTILYYLYLGGKIKQKAISSQEAFDLFGITVENRHSALGDALATAKLFTILLRLITKNTRMKVSSLKDQPNLFE